MARIQQPNFDNSLAAAQNTAPRSGVSPIGTVSPNTGSTGNTNSTYGQGFFASGIAEPAATFYTVQNTDYQGVVLFDTDSSIGVTLNSAVQANFTCTILNLDSGPITLTPTLGYLVNGSPSLTMAPHQGAIVFFANRAWSAFVGATIIPVVPVNFNPVAGEFLTGYNSSTGIFSAAAIVSFGTGAPSGSSTEGNIYFDTSVAPYNGYVFHSAAWHQFS